MSNAIKIESETVKKIRQMFPKPVRCGSSDSASAYCVIGALAMYARRFVPDTLFAARPPLANEKITGVKKQQYLDRIADPFPYSSFPAKLLQKMNCSLDADTASDFARDIIRFNDTGKFGQAWGKLSEALTYDPDNCA